VPAGAGTVTLGGGCAGVFPGADGPPPPTLEPERHLHASNIQKLSGQVSTGQGAS